jgi:rhodanese-related sulfurtransferase
MNIVKRDELKTRIDRGDVTVIDARSEQAFAEGHLPSALSLPADKVAERAAEILPDKSRTVVAYCGNISCPKSGQAAEKLRDLGYTNIIEYTDGFEDWSKSGLPVETGARDEGPKAKRFGTFN